MMTDVPMLVGRFSRSSTRAKKKEKRRTRASIVYHHHEPHLPLDVLVVGLERRDLRHLRGRVFAHLANGLA